jgi:hypothetical protein
MAVAVTILTTVTIINFTEASRHLITAYLTPSLNESFIPKTVRKILSC